MSQHFRADIHCHTFCSDGSESPEQVLNLAVERGLKGLSITDHDSADAYDVVFPIAKKLGLRMITGVEFSTMHRGESIHILGYGYDRHNDDFEAFCERHHRRRKERNQRFIEKLREQGVMIEEDELLQTPKELLPRGRQTTGRPHIAQAMMKHGFVSSVDRAFKEFIGEGRPLFVPGAAFSVEETIDVIHRAGGYAVIAHPHFIKRKSILNDLFAMPFDGLEAYYAKLPKQQEGPWARKAEELGWFYTGGSDFHGTVKPHIQLGASWTNEETFSLLEKRHKENNGDG